MKIIEILNNKTNDSKYDEMIGHYKVIENGMDDIVIIKNYEYREIKEVETCILGVKSHKYVIKKNTNADKYIVKPLDTLEAIANKYNMSKDELIKKNDLVSDKVFIGQILTL